MDTKEKLIKSALELFMEKWFDNTSTASIAKNAWLATWTLFVHFKSKDELLENIYISIKKEAHTYVFKDLNKELSPLEKLKFSYIKTFEFYTRNYEKLTFVEQFSSSSNICKINMKDIENEMREFEKIFDEAKKSWIIWQKDNELLYASIWWLFYSLSKYIKKTWEEKIDDCVEILINALK